MRRAVQQNSARFRSMQLVVRSNGLLLTPPAKPEDGLSLDGDGLKAALVDACQQHMDAHKAQACFSFFNCDFRFDATQAYVLQQQLLQHALPGAQTAAVTAALLQAAPVTAALLERFFKLALSTRRKVQDVTSIAGADTALGRLLKKGLAPENEGEWMPAHT